MTDGFHEMTWRGTAFDVPAVGGHLVPEDPDTFTATMRWVRLDHVRVHLLVAGPHRYTTGPRPAGTPPLAMLAVGEGEFEFLFGDRTAVLRRGDLAVTDELASLGHRAPEPVRLLWTVIARDHIPPDLFTGTPFPAFLARTRLVNSYLAFLSALMTSRSSTEHSPEAFLARAVIDLQVGVLAERRRLVAVHDDRLVGLRMQMERHIEDNLGDPRLDPASIAQALGVSLRYAHQVFNRDDETLAASVRNRRLEAVAKDLRDPGRETRPGELASRYGFASRDQLGRAFRRRYGLTMSEYREQVGG